MILWCIVPLVGIEALSYYLPGYLPYSIFLSSNSDNFLDISVGPLVPVPVGGISSLLDRSTSSIFLVRGDRSNPFF